MMNINFYFRLSLNMVTVFMVAMALSGAPDLFPELFGDYKCEGSHYDSVNNMRIGCNAEPGSHDSTWHWGYRHWLWFAMGLSLFVVQVFRIGEIINKKSK